MPGFEFAPAGSLDRLGLACPLLTATGWIDGLAQLVAAGGGDGTPLADVLQGMFAPLGLSFQHVGSPSGGPAAMVAARRTGRPVCTIYFDAVEPVMDAGAAGSPAILVREGSRLYGPGTATMTGAIAAVWAAFRAADAVGLKLGLDPVLLFSTVPRDDRHAALRHLTAEGQVQGHLLYLSGPDAGTSDPQGHLPLAPEPKRGPDGERWQQALDWAFAHSGLAPLHRTATWCAPPPFLRQAGVREVLLGGLRPSARGGGDGEHVTVEDVEGLARAMLAYFSDVQELPVY